MVSRDQPLIDGGCTRIIHGDSGHGDRWVLRQRPRATLSQFEDDVAQRRVAYYIVVNSRGRGPGSTSRGHSDIANWVAVTFPSSTVGDATVYDLSAPK
jgi:hypothetical protein